MKKAIKFLLFKWKVYAWEVEVKKETNRQAKLLNIKRNTWSYTMLMNEVANDLMTN